LRGVEQRREAGLACAAGVLALRALRRRVVLRTQLFEQRCTGVIPRSTQFLRRRCESHADACLVLCDERVEFKRRAV
jgi:hypothetical protein